MKIDLSDGFLASVSTDAGKRLEAIDSGQKGLVLRVSSTGTKTWTFLYRRGADQKRCRVTIGQYPELGLVDARARAARLQRDVDCGGDPAGNVPTGGMGLTYGLFVEEYIELHAKRHKRSWARDREMLERDVVSTIGHLRLAAIDQTDVRAIVDAIDARGAPVQAARVFEILRKSFNFAISRGHLSVNPCRGVAPPPPPAGKRQRCLAPAEIRMLWDRLAGAHMAWRTQQVLRLCLVTAQSVGDVSGTRKDEVDFDEAIWEIPSTRSRNRVAHRVPLSPLAMKLFSEAVRQSGGGDFVFPGKSNRNALTAHAVARAMRGNLEYLELENVTPNDLMRTAVSGMRELGIARLTIGKVLNHISMDPSVNARDRNKYEFEREKRIALESWTLRLQELTGSAMTLHRTSSPWRDEARKTTVRVTGG